jgi:hypothetical protein
MELIVKRTTRTEKSTIGELWIDGKFFCYTLEDKDRGLKQTDAQERIKAKKVFGATAIPAGRYEVKLTYSNRFKKVMPQIMNVPGFEGIRIHAGNTDKDTEGCLLVGMEKTVDSVLKSRVAFSRLLDLLLSLPKEDESYVILNS